MVDVARDLVKTSGETGMESAKGADDANAATDDMRAESELVAEQAADEKERSQRVADDLLAEQKKEAQRVKDRFREEARGATGEFVKTKYEVQDGFDASLDAVEQDALGVVGEDGQTGSTRDTLRDMLQNRTE